MITHEMPSILQVSWVDQMMPMSPMSSQDNTLLWVIIGLLTLIIAYLWYIGRERVLTARAMKLLSPNERIVVEALVNNGGEMVQKDIHYDLGLSRVQAHRIVQGLTQREIVSVEDHYNTKKVRLADWLMR